MKNNIRKKIIKTKLLKILRINTIIAFIVMMLLITTCLTTALSNNLPKEGDKPKTIKNVLEYSYTFSSIEHIQTSDGTVLQIEGLSTYTPRSGVPIIPTKPVTFIIPEGTKIERIQVESEGEIRLRIPYKIAPAPQVIPLSHRGPIEETEPDRDIYNSNEPYPGRSYEVVTYQYRCGIPVVTLNLFPLQIIPNPGEMLYTPEMTVKITLSPDRRILNNIQKPRMLSDDIIHLQKQNIENPEMLTTYTRYVQTFKPDRSRINPIDPDDTVTYVIITNEELRDSNAEYTFQDLVQSKINKGLTAAIVTVEEIIACPDYWWDGQFGDGEPLYNDTPCHIRNFIKDAYYNWDTIYVLLGGDGDGADVGNESGDNIIPVRIIDFGESVPIASDLYYACLDGSYDSNGNGVFGEYGDGFDINDDGEVDLRSEVYIGRAPVDSAEELSNFVRKTLAYENCEIDESLREVLMAAEDLGEPMGFGAFFKEEIRKGSSEYGYTTVGIPDLYNVSTLYDRDWEEQYWPKSEILTRINNGIHIINHLGHGNNFKVMKFYEPVKPIEVNDEIEFIPCHDVTENLINDQYFFGYSQACFSGSFDNKWPLNGGQYLEWDCIIEQLIGAPHGAFAFIANTRYGLGSVGSTNGPSQNYDREFFDALFGENLRNLGVANQDSKEDNIGKLGDFGLRYCYFEITLFGDPELSIKDPPLRNHDLGVTEIDAPSYSDINTNIEINATICNRGLNNETDIIVNLLIDESIINSTFVSSLHSQDCVEVSFIWTTDMIGNYMIQVEVEPVPGEDFLENNIKTEYISISPYKPVKAAVLDGFTADFGTLKYKTINSKWDEYGDIPVDVDYYTLNHEGITYEEINATGADVLIVDTSMPHPYFQWEFTLDEINAITRFIEEGHGLIAFFATFGGNNNLLLPLVGLNTDAEHKDLDGQAIAKELTILDEDHALFQNIPNPCPLYMNTIRPYDGTWDENELSNSVYIAKGTNGDEVVGAIAVNVNNALYISMTFWEYDNDYNNQLLYNALIFADTPADFYALAGGPYKGVVEEPIQFHGFAGCGKPPYSYHWDFDDGTNSTDKNPVKSYNASGNYTITFTVVDNQDNVRTDITTVTINEPEPFEADANGLYRGLVDEPVQFIGSVEGGVPPYTYHWDFGDGTNSSKQNPKKGYSYAGTYTVNFTVTDYVDNTSTNTTLAIIYSSYPSSVYVDDDFNSSTPGWQIDHFDKIQDGIDVVSRLGTVYVSNGIYLEAVEIHKPIAVNGENKNMTILDGSGTEYAVDINLYYDDTEGVTLNGLTIKNNGKELYYGIGLYTNNNIITDNIIRESYFGIYLKGKSGSSFNHISENTILNCHDGIYLLSEESINNSIKNNTITENAIGIRIYKNCDNNILAGNAIMNNTYTGIYIGGSAKNNIIYHNKFINNEQNAYDKWDNQWYHEILKEGNYWDDFEDNPGYPFNYTIPGGSVDLYPLNELDGFIVNAYGPYMGNVGELIQFKGAAAGGEEPYNWSWDFGDGNTSEEQNPTYTYGAANIYTVTLTVTDNIGNTSNDTTTAIIAPLVTYVDDDYNETMDGWGYTYFDNVQDGINGVAKLGKVIVYDGVYYEHIIINKTIELIGLDKDRVIIDGNGNGSVIKIISQYVKVRGFTIQNCHEGDFQTPDPPAAIDIHSNSNSITKNIITGNDYGVSIPSASYNYILCNNITNNNYGVCIGSNVYGQGGQSGPGPLGPPANHNKVYHNNFINNNQSAHDEFDNDWYSTILYKGNYWDDFDEPGEGAWDNDSDGIVDTPYSIPGGDNKDMYPFINPYLPILGDINGDGFVNIQDIYLILSNWGSCEGCPEDLNGDGTVDIDDVFIVLANWT